MTCPSCRKRVVFGSIRADAWEKVKSGEWIYGGRPPAPEKPGDCPVCGSRLDWEPGEAPAASPERVHLSALRETPERWNGRRVWFRAIAVEVDGALLLSDSWRARPKAGPPESDGELVTRLGREQVPPVTAVLADETARIRFADSSRALATGTRAAWVEAEGVLDAVARRVEIGAIHSIWPPRD